MSGRKLSGDRRKSLTACYRQNCKYFTPFTLLLQGNCKEDPLASYELICSLHSLILSIEQLQASFLLNPEKYTDELATQPRRLLNTLRYRLS